MNTRLSAHYYWTIIVNRAMLYVGFSENSNMKFLYDDSGELPVPQAGIRPPRPDPGEESVKPHRFKILLQEKGSISGNKAKFGHTQVNKISV